MASWGTYWLGYRVSLEDGETQTLLDAPDKFAEVRRMFHNPPLPDGGYNLASFFWVYPQQVRWAKSYGRGIWVYTQIQMWYWNFYWLSWVWPRWG
jgi:hypothetical protein